MVGCWGSTIKNDISTYLQKGRLGRNLLTDFTIHYYHCKSKKKNLLAIICFISNYSHLPLVIKFSSSASEARVNLII